jgi:hypothetical protein
MSEATRPEPVEATPPALKPWSDPAITELEVSRTANNPSAGSDGGTGDCQHI